MLRFHPLCRLAAALLVGLALTLAPAALAAPAETDTERSWTQGPSAALEALWDALSALWQAVAGDQGGYIDPVGSDSDNTSHIDPDGPQSDDDNTSHIDPNG